jgi:hypothetical protein
MLNSPMRIRKHRQIFKQFCFKHINKINSHQVILKLATEY